jgi:putative sterol carrier protein
MAEADELKDSLESFASSCNENERLMSMIKDWNRVLHIHASDSGANHTLTTSNGTVTTVPTAPTSADLVVSSSADTLAKIFYGELSPNEPYNDGSLQLRGPEDDIVRLDFVIAMLWE